MYMDDAIRATIELTEAPANQVKVRSSYNLAGISFDPATIGASIKKVMPEFELDCTRFQRRNYVSPESIDDSTAQVIGIGPRNTIWTP